MMEVNVLHQPVAEGIERARQTFRSVLVSLVQAVDPMDPLRFYAAGRDRFAGERMFWSDASQAWTLVGLGTAYRLQNDADDPFHDLEAFWHTLVESAIVTPATRNPGTGPVLIGGFAFDTQRKRTTLWQRFANATMVLPKFMLTVRQDGETWLTTNVLVHPNDQPDLYRTLVQEQQELFRTYLHIDSEQITEFGSDFSPFHYEELAVPEWIESVRQLTEEMKQGELEKVVLARELRVHAAKPFASETILSRLRVQQPGSYVFALESGDDCFLGATPERLVKKEGDTCLSACLAGTIRRGKTEEEDVHLGNQLLQDPKNLHEHEVVVRIIQRSLANVCEEVSVPDAPQLYKVRDVQHLYTPVVGKVKPGVSILEMVKQLHPTPALGGFPRELALMTIRQHEPFERGFYGSPVGWLDRYGNGEFAVAIRSGLLQGNEASLFAGCGIVGDSDPLSEYRETHLKFKPMIAALGGTWHDAQ